MFTHHPQAVEVYQAGTWWAGELLGWRHEADGSCQMCVRVVLGGAAETAWVDLAGLRLPERPAPVASGAVPVPATREVEASMSPHRDASTTQKLPRAGVSRPERPGPGVVTAGTPATRTLAAAPPAPSGRRRAPEEPGTTALTAQPPLRSGGRRRGPEPADQPATTTTGATTATAATARAAGSPPRDGVSVAAAPTPTGGGRRRAPEGAGPAEPLTDAVPTAGRHRSAPPAGQGRHRTADTGMFAAVQVAVQVAAPVATPSGSHPVGRAPSVPVPRPASAGRGRSGAPAGAWSSSGEAEPELLTRPMRLSDHLPGARRSSVDAR